MTICGRIEIPDPQTLRDDLSRCQDLREIAEVVQRSVGNTGAV